MKFLKDCSFFNKKVLVRVDFNVPIDKKTLEIQDSTRIDYALPTLEYILEKGGKLIIMSHLGRPKGKIIPKYSLAPIQTYLSIKLKRPVQFASDCISTKSYEASKNLKAGEILLLENVRFYAQETEGNRDFAKALSHHADIYVNDAFGSAHRAHASTTTIANFVKEKVCGLLLEAELNSLNKILNNPVSPFTAIVGGAKISDKILVLESLVDKVNNLLIGGAMAYTFFKAKGGKVGDSLVEADKVDLALRIMEKAKSKGVKILLPIDSIVQKLGTEEYKTSNNDAIEKGWMGIDIAEKACQTFSTCISESNTLLWNGPMGIFERPEGAKGTLTIAKSVAKRTQAGSGAVFSLIGGGDTVSAIKQTGLANSISYISTGGGALLEFIEGKTLPGVAALMN